MLEIGIISVIVLAIAYWTVLWTMGRREDVLHGEFVRSDGQPAEVIRPIFPEPSVRPVFPERPIRSVFPAKLAEIAIPEPAARTALPDQPAFRPERLESLLNSIKQDLNQLVQK